MKRGLEALTKVRRSHNLFKSRDRSPNSRAFSIVKISMNINTAIGLMFTNKGPNTQRKGSKRAYKRLSQSPQICRS